MHLLANFQCLSTVYCPSAVLEQPELKQLLGTIPSLQSLSATIMLYEPYSLSWLSHKRLGELFVELWTAARGRPYDPVTYTPKPPTGHYDFDGPIIDDTNLKFDATKLPMLEKLSVSFGEFGRQTVLHIDGLQRLHTLSIDFGLASTHPASLSAVIRNAPLLEEATLLDGWCSRYCLENVPLLRSLSVFVDMYHSSLPRDFNFSELPNLEEVVCNPEIVEGIKTSMKNSKPVKPIQLILKDFESPSIMRFDVSHTGLPVYKIDRGEKKQKWKRS